MDLAAIVRRAVEQANSTTASLQVEVQHKIWDGTLDVNAQPSYLSPIGRMGLVEWKQTWVRTLTGQEARSNVYIAFIEPIEISKYDEFMVPGDTEWRSIMTWTGFVDAGTGQPYFAEVYLG